MKSFNIIGRILFALPMAIFGINHLIGADKMQIMVPPFIPGGIVWVYLTGIALILAAVSIIIKKKASLATLLLAIMLIIFVLTIHIPGLSNPQMAMMAMVGMLKDTSLAGGALFLSYYFRENNQ